MYARNVQLAIEKEIGCAECCLIINEAHDESKKEQMAHVVRFVEKEGFIVEHFCI